MISTGYVFSRDDFSGFSGSENLADEVRLRQSGYLKLSFLLPRGIMFALLIAPSFSKGGLYSKDWRFSYSGEVKFFLGEGVSLSVYASGLNGFPQGGSSYYAISSGATLSWWIRL